jgi:predicted RNA-binding Zn-ribbon protein involved in translation (DUF1610 family)
MNKVCLRCGYERTEKDFAPEFECPKCGVIYEKTGTQVKTTEQYAKEAARVIEAAKAGKEVPIGRTRSNFPVFAFLILAAVVVSLFFLGYRNGFLSRFGFGGIDSGTIKDSVYKNRYFGFEVTLPESWSPVDRDAQEKMTDMAGKMLAGNNRSLEGLLNASSEDAVSMFTVFKHPLGTPVPFNPSVVCMAQKVNHFPGIKKGSDYLYHLKTVLDTLDFGPISVEYSGSTNTEELGGVDFDVLDLRVQIGNTAITQKHYARIMKGYVLSYTLTYQAWDDMEELDSCLETVRFI